MYNTNQSETGSGCKGPDNKSKGLISSTSFVTYDFGQIISVFFMYICIMICDCLLPEFN